MQIQCPACRAKILADDVSLNTRMAKCRGCNNVFEFGSAVPAVEEPLEAPRPAKFKVRETPGEIEITWRWFTPAHLFMAFFAAAWDSFLVFWYTMAFKTGAPWIMKVFPIAHLAVGVGITYAVLLGFWNRTTVRASRDEISFRSGPLPCRRDRLYRAGDLRRVFVMEATPYNRGNSPAQWKLVGVGRDGGEIPLLGSLADETQARYLAQKLGPFLEA